MQCDNNSSILIHWSIILNLYMILIKRIFLLLFVFIAFTAKTQNADSLIRLGLANLTKDDSLSKIYFLKAMSKAIQEKNALLIQKARLYDANADLNLGKKDSFLIKIKSVAKEIQTSKNLENISVLNSIYSVYYYNENKLDTCLKYVLYCLEYAEKTTDFSKQYDNTIKLSMLYSKLNNDTEGLRYGRKAKLIAKKLSEPSKLTRSLYTMAFAYNNLAKHDSALLCLDEALSISKLKTDSNSLAIIYSNLAYTYSLTNDLKKAITYSKQSFQIRKNLGNPIRIALGLLDLSDYLTSSGMFDESLRYLDTTYTYVKLTGQSKLYITLYENQYKALKGKGDFKAALIKYEQAQRLQDSLFTDENKQSIEKLQKDYEISSRETKITLLDKENEIKRLAIDKGKFQLQIGIVVSIILIGFLIFVIYSFLKKKKLSAELQVKNTQVNSQNNTLKSLNKMLIDSEDELQKANSTKERLLSIISHDLSNPSKALRNYLTAKVGAVESLSKDELIDVLRKIDSNVEGMNDLLENLITWSYLQKADLKPNIELVSLLNVVSDCTKIYTTEINTKQLKLVVNIEEKDTIQSDKNLISVIIRNILNNAIKYSFNGGDIIVDFNATKMEFCIKDSGTGLTAEQLIKINNGESPDGLHENSGTGLGTTLVISCLRLIGSKWRVESKVGEGTSFTFSV